jgi:hypothetical protein
MNLWRLVPPQNLTIDSVYEEVINTWGGQQQTKIGRDIDDQSMSYIWRHFADVEYPRCNFINSNVMWRHTIPVNLDESYYDQFGMQPAIWKLCNGQGQTEK